MRPRPGPRPELTLHPPKCRPRYDYSRTTRVRERCGHQPHRCRSWCLRRSALDGAEDDTPWRTSAPGAETRDRTGVFDVISIAGTTCPLDGWGVQRGLEPLFPAVTRTPRGIPRQRGEFGVWLLLEAQATLASSPGTRVAVRAASSVGLAESNRREPSPSRIPVFRQPLGGGNGNPWNPLPPPSGPGDKVEQGLVAGAGFEPA